ncbi:MAG: TetR/AcrR family transcriptional regulator [Solirubrobacterales bacterium]
MAPEEQLKKLERGEPLPRGRHRLERDVVLASQRGRLMSAFVRLAADRGYDGVTIIDIVSLAGTSKRTFYEHFTDKQDCLVQSFDTARTLLISAMVTEAGPVEDPIERIVVGVRAYIDALTEMPDFTRLFLNESMSAGKELADRWTESAEMFAGVLARWRSESRREHPEVPELSPLQALIVITGINEVVCMTVHRDGVDAVKARTDELVEQAVALLTAPH